MIIPTREDILEVMKSLNNFELDGGWLVSDDDMIAISGKKLHALLTICEYYVKEVLIMRKDSKLTTREIKSFLHRFWDKDNPYICGKPTNLVIDRLAELLYTKIKENK